MLIFQLSKSAGWLLRYAMFCIMVKLIKVRGTPCIRAILRNAIIDDGATSNAYNLKQEH